MRLNIMLEILVTSAENFLNNCSNNNRSLKSNIIREIISQMQ